MKRIDCGEGLVIMEPTESDRRLLERALHRAAQLSAELRDFVNYASSAYLYLFRPYIIEGDDRVRVKYASVFVDVKAPLPRPIEMGLELGILREVDREGDVVLYASYPPAFATYKGGELILAFHRDAMKKFMEYHPQAGLAVIYHELLHHVLGHTTDVTARLVKQASLRVLNGPFLPPEKMHQLWNVVCDVYIVEHLTQMFDERCLRVFADGGFVARSKYRSVEDTEARLLSDEVFEVYDALGAPTSPLIVFEEVLRRLKQSQPQQNQGNGKQNQGNGKSKPDPTQEAIERLRARNGLSDHGAAYWFDVIPTDESVDPETEAQIEAFQSEYQKLRERSAGSDPLGAVAQIKIKRESGTLDPETFVNAVVVRTSPDLMNPKVSIAEGSLVDEELFPDRLEPSPRICTILDTSGSMFMGGDDNLALAEVVVPALKAMADYEGGILIHCDAAVQVVESLTAEAVEAILTAGSLRVGGGGGTNLNPAVAEAMARDEDEPFDVVFIATDGYLFDAIDHHHLDWLLERSVQVILPEGGKPLEGIPLDQHWCVVSGGLKNLAEVNE